MLQQDKQRFLILLGFLVVFGLAVYYVLWAFMLNKGTIYFDGAPPYSITLNGAQYECSLVRCEFTVKEDTYDYTISKEKYSSKSGSIVLKRGEEVAVDALLEFVPTIKGPLEYTLYSLPAGYSKFKNDLKEISLFKTYDPNYALERLPKKPLNVVFGGSGEKVLVFEEDKASVYSVADFSSASVDGVVEAVDGDFNKAEDTFYTIGYDEASDKSALIKAKTDGTGLEKLIYFNRDVTDYQLEISEDEKLAVLADRTNVPTIIYLIDLENDTRTNVYEGTGISLGNFSSDGTYFIFEGKDYFNNLPSLKYIDILSKAIEDFGFNADTTQFVFDDNSIGYFVTDSLFELSGYDAKFIDNNIDNLTVEDLISEVSEPKTLNLFKWDARLKEYYLVANLDKNIGQRPDKIEVNQDGSIVRILVGEDYYDIELKE